METRGSEVRKMIYEGAEECLEAGDFREAKQHFKEAKKLREEATEAIINGEEPPL